jgi:flagella basal body P-ring formation protein FlgA
MNMIKIALLLCLWLLPNILSAAEFELRAEEVEVAIADALAKAEVAQHPRVVITSNRTQTLYKAESPVEVEINQLTHNEDKRTWVANMLILQNKNVLSAKPLSGKYEEQIGVPVLRDRFNNGEIIEAKDIEMRYLAQYKVPRGTVTDANSIIGLTPARLISKERPIREQELVKPTLIKKGTIVQMMFQTNAIEISTVGEALDDGAINDTIRVRNNDSKQVVRAKIISNNQVLAGAI